VAIGKSPSCLQKNVKGFYLKRMHQEKCLKEEGIFREIENI